MDAEIVASVLIEKLGKLLHGDPIILHLWFKKQVQTAFDELKLLKQWMEDKRDREASRRHSVDDHRMNRLLQAVYLADDATDALILRTELQQIRKTENRFQPFMYLTSSYNQILFNHEMRKSKITEIRGLMEGRLGDNNNTRSSSEYDIEGGVGDGNNSRSSSQNYRGWHSQQPRWGRISDFCLEETNAVGFGRQIKELVDRLVHEGNTKEIKQDRGRPTQVIAVIGKGGSGKTTLARTVYNKVEVKRHFANLAWVHVSNVFTARHLLADLLIQIDPKELVVEATLSEEELMWRITEVLNRYSRYLIVMENVETQQVWESVLDALCSSTHGGKIIITTRTKNNGVPPTADFSTLLVPRLNNMESWELFSKKAGVAQDGLTELTQLKGPVLHICGGLPLHILLVCGLLNANKERSSDELRRLIERATAEDIFALSYQDLPSQVKPCFLYMGLFPREFEIPVRRLIHLWCAEGFVTASSSEEVAPEDVAEVYFEELVIRNMIQVRWKLDGSPKTCHMHSVVYDTFSQKAADAGFLYHQLQSSHKSTQRQQLFAVRRQAAYLGIKNIPSSPDVWHLRSYIAFETRIRGTSARQIGMILNEIISNRGFGLLNVLDLEGVYRPMLSDAVIGKLLHLKYLGLRSTILDSLPQSVGEMPCLETLDVRDTRITDYRCLSKANKLRHLYLNRSNEMKLRIDYGALSSLTNLHTLWGLLLSKEDFEVENSFLEKLIRLRKLWLIIPSLLELSRTTIRVILGKWVAPLKELQTLKLTSFDEEFEFWSMTEYHKLQDLYFRGSPPQGSSFNLQFLPPNLRTLTLSQTELKDNPMPVLGQLPHLNILRLIGNAYIGEQITCLAAGFPKLRVFKLWKLRWLHSLTMEDGAMPSLIELEIRRCIYLNLPTGLEHLTTLKELVITNMEVDFISAVKRIMESRDDVYVKINRWESD